MKYRIVKCIYGNGREEYQVEKTFPISIQEDGWEFVLMTRDINSARDWIKDHEIVSREVVE
jgi:hypothetical protein